MPLLYVNRLASIEHLDIDPDLDGRIRQAIERELSRQSASGAFGMWSADENNEDPWLDAFVTDFLTRARERNFAVPQQAFDQALDRLRNEVVNAPEPSKDNAEALAYALYVLARNGRPVIGDLRYLTDAKLDAFATPLGKAQLAAALAMLGDRARAGKTFGAALAALDAERDNGVSRADYGSRLRDAAAVLALIAEANLGGEIEGDAIARAGAVLDQARAQRSFTSTQENNWMALAAEALAEHASREPVQHRRPAGEGRPLSPLQRRVARRPVDRGRQRRRDSRRNSPYRSPARRSSPTLPSPTAIRSSARSTSSTEPRSTRCNASRRTSASWCRSR